MDVQPDPGTTAFPARKSEWSRDANYQVWRDLGSLFFSLLRIGENEKDGTTPRSITHPSSRTLPASD